MPLSPLLPLPSSAPSMLYLISTTRSFSARLERARKGVLRRPGGGQAALRGPPGPALLPTAPGWKLPQGCTACTYTRPVPARRSPLPHSPPLPRFRRKCWARAGPRAVGAARGAPPAAPRPPLPREKPPSYITAAQAIIQHQHAHTPKPQKNPQRLAANFPSTLSFPFPARALSLWRHSPSSHVNRLPISVSAGACTKAPGWSPVGRVGGTST